MIPHSEDISIRPKKSSILRPFFCFSALILYSSRLPINNMGKTNVGIATPSDVVTTNHRLLDKMVPVHEKSKNKKLRSKQSLRCWPAQPELKTDIFYVLIHDAGYSVYGSQCHNAMCASMHLRRPRRYTFF